MDGALAANQGKNLSRDDDGIPPRRSLSSTDDATVPVGAPDVHRAAVRCSSGSPARRLWRSGKPNDRPHRPPPAGIRSTCESADLRRDQMKLVRCTPLRAVSGFIGTAAMDLVWYLRYRRNDGRDSFWRWEFAGNVTTWDEASAPGQVGRKALRSVLGHEPPDRWARATTNTVHWATGAAWGA